MAIHFQHPHWLWLLLTIGLFMLLYMRTIIWRRHAWHTFAQTLSPARLTNVVMTRRPWAWFAGLGLLIIALAGPRWGLGGETGVIIGRDVMIILDLSHSMEADDMADAAYPRRWQAAQASIRDMITDARRRGGHRFGLIVFAAKPTVVCPLTSDDAHFLNRLEEYSPKAPPPEVRPGADEAISSGTSIGAAIALGLHVQDPRFPGYRDILLFTDGDGPGVTSEVQVAITLAAEQGVPVHVIGLGDPVHPTELTLGAAQEDFVGTQLREEILQDIARRTNGEYIPARRDRPNMAEWFINVLEQRPSRTLSDDLIPQPKDRRIWFMLAGLVLIVYSWGRRA